MFPILGRTRNIEELLLSYSPQSGGGDLPDFNLDTRTFSGGRGLQQLACRHLVHVLLARRSGILWPAPPSPRGSSHPARG